MKSKNTIVDHLCEHITNYPYQPLHKQKCLPNIGRKEWSKLNRIKDDKTTTIKKAYKESAIILMDTVYHISLIKSILEDTAHYKKDAILQPVEGNGKPINIYAE